MKTLVKQLNMEHRAVGSYQRSALKHALICGTLLHYAKSQQKHGEWLDWLKANFNGSERVAREYMTVARAWANRRQSADLENAAGFKEALDIAKTTPVEKDLPACLPGLMDPPKFRMVKNQQEQTHESRQPVIGGKPPRIAPDQLAAARAAITEAIEVNTQRAAALEADQEAREIREAEEQNRQIDAEFDLILHPQTAAGDASRKAEKLLTKAASTYGTPEAGAFADKALSIITQYNLKVLVVCHG